MLAFGQSATPGKPVFQNSRLTVTQSEIPPGAALVPDKHERDLITIMVSGAAPKSKLAPGTVFFTRAGTTEQRVKNTTPTPLKAVTVEFAAAQGEMDWKFRNPTRYCNPGSKTACVDEKYLLCTAKVCVEEVRMGAGAISTKHSHDTDHMIVAISDYSLADDVVGKEVTMRDVKSGGVEYIPAGITHTLTNKSGKEIHFVVVVFR